MIKRFSIALALALSLPAFAAELRVPIPGRDDLILDVPAGWKSEVRRPRAEMPPTIVLTSERPRDFHVSVSPMWPVGAAKSPSKSDIKALVEGAAKQAQAQAEEKQLPLKELEGPGKSGYYFSATDRKPEPAGFKHMTQGAVAFNELRVAFTILANAAPDKTTASALQLVRSMRRGPASKGS
jgi:hypothetical protein